MQKEASHEANKNGSFLEEDVPFGSFQLGEGRASRSRNREYVDRHRSEVQKLSSFSKAQLLLGRILLLGWYFWTLPFRLALKLSWHLFQTLALHSLDNTQEMVIGKKIVSFEECSAKLISTATPLWNAIFPFQNAMIRAIEKQLFRGFFRTESHHRHKGRPRRQEYDSSELDAPGLSSMRTEKNSKYDNIYQDEITSSLPGQHITQRAKLSKKSTTQNIREEEETPQVRARNGEEETDEIPFDFDSRFSADSIGSADNLDSNLSSKEIDDAVMLAIEARQTHVVVEKLFWVAIVLLAIIGIILLRIDFTRKWATTENNNSPDLSLGFEGIYGVLIVLTIAFRSDYPFNLTILVLVTFYAGCVLGIVLAYSFFLPAGVQSRTIPN